jgi:hypothetical protein
MINWPEPSYEGEIYTSPDGYSWVWNGYGWNTLGAEAPNAPIDIIYEDFYNLLSQSSLLPGKLYRIYDFQTVHYILEDPSLSVNTAREEPIYVLATSTSTIDKKVVSENYPEDIIYWDPEPSNWLTDQAFSDTSASPVAIVRGFKGVITYRKDCVKNIETFYDWRSFLFRRWTIDRAGFPAWGSGTTYSPGDLATGDGGYFVCTDADVASSVDPANNNKWTKLISTHCEYCLVQPYDYSLSIGDQNISFTIPVDNTNYTDFNCVSKLRYVSNYKEDIRQISGQASELTSVDFASTSIPNCVTDILLNDYISDISFTENSFCNTIIAREKNYSEGITLKGSSDNIITITGKSPSKGLNIQSSSSNLILGFHLLASIEYTSLSVLMGDIVSSTLNGLTSSLFSVPPGTTSNDITGSSNISNLNSCSIKCLVIDSNIRRLSHCYLGRPAAVKTIQYLDFENLSWTSFSSSNNIYDTSYSKKIMGTTGSPYMLYIGNTGTLQTILATS